MSVRVFVHVLALAFVAPIAVGPAEAGERGSPATAVAPNGALATYAQVLPPNGDPRVAPWTIGNDEPVGGVFSPDGRSVAYTHYVVRREEDEPTLRVLDAGGSPRVVWDVNRLMRLPTWSADGELLAIATGNFGMVSRNSDLWLVPTDGSESPEQILAGRGGELDVVSWSPDGSTLAYVRYASDVFLYDVATGTSTQLTDFCTWEDAEPPGPGPDCDALTFGWGSLAWSPDGDQLLGTVNRKVVLVDAETGVVTDVGAPSAPFYYSAVWSPDGSEIAYTRAVRPSFRPTTLVRPLAGGEERVVADNQVTSWQACPEGSCPTFGRSRARSDVRASVSRQRNAVKVNGEVGPLTEPNGSGRETVRVTVQVKRSGSWRNVQAKDARLDWEQLTFAASLKRPDGNQCRVRVGYEGGWTRGPSSDTVPFRC